MVNCGKNHFISAAAFLLIAAVFLLQGCEFDLFGVFASTDLDERFRERDSFKLLSKGDLNPSLGDTFSFVVLCDTHIDDGDAHGLEKLKELTAGNSTIKFVVVNGDIVNSGSRNEIARFAEIAKSLPVPCYPAPGNHDIFNGGWQDWKELIGSTCYRVSGGGATGGGATLLVLDSANAYLGADQLDWLEENLKSAKGRVFVFSHVNLFTESPADLQQFTSTRERARIVSLLKGRCDAVFTGHVHKRIIKEAGGVKYITVEDYVRSSTYCLVSVSPNGISWEFKQL